MEQNYDHLITLLEELVSVGPNYLWHIDGYDKIKPYGFAIHGAIDGLSRKILWLRVASPNNNPKTIASYYMDCIRQLELVPRAIRSDRGTENTIICGIQRFLSRNAEDLISNKDSFVYGSSTRNQHPLDGTHLVAVRGLIH